MLHATQHTIIRLLYGAMIVFALQAKGYAQGYSGGPIPDSNREIADIYFAPANKKTLVVVYKDAALARVDIFRHVGVTLLPVSTLTKALGVPLEVNMDNGTAEGTLFDNRSVMLIPARNTVMIGGVEKKQVPGLMFLRDGEIYIDRAVFAEVFGLSVYVNFGADTLRIVRDEAEEAPAEKPAAVPPAPAPETPPAVAAPAPTPVPAAESKPVDTAVEHVTVSEPKASSAPAIAAPVSGEPEEPLVLQLVIDDVTMEEFVEGVQKGDKLYLPLGQLTSLIDFAITVDLPNKNAKGWFIREENGFVLTEQSAQIKGETTHLPPGSVLVKDQDLFVDADLLQYWFPIDFLMDRYNMTLLLHVRETLPFQEKLMRKKRRDQLEQKAALEEKEATYQKIDFPYEAASLPYLNMTLSPSYQKQSNEKRLDYTLIASGDLAYMNGHIYAGGDLNEQTFTDLRFYLGKSDYERNLLGPMQASAFSLGDINSVGLSQATQSSSGRGVTVTNRAANRSDKFDVTSFIGDATPGWEAELYRNSVLVSSQTIGADGRYAFTDIPILFGNNTFRLVLFGPQGQVDEIVKNINASSALLEAGEFTYNFSADEKNETVFNVAATQLEDTGLRTVGEVEYGVSRWLTLTAGGARTMLNDERYDYATAGARTALGATLLNLDGAYDIGNDAYSTRLALFANYWDTDIRLQHKFAQDFVSEETGYLDNTIERVSEIGLDRQSVLPVIGDLNAGISLVRKTFESGRVDSLWVNRLSTSVYGINMTNSLQYAYDTADSESMTGSFALRGFYDKVLLGGQMNYTVKTTSRLTDAKLTANYPIVADISGNTSLLKYFQGDKHSEFENTLTFDMRKYRLSFTGRASSNSSHYVGMSLNVSTGKIPGSDNWMFSSKNMADTGTVVVKPYLDRNYNQQQDEGEEAPENIAFKVGSQEVKKNENGDLVATTLPINTPVRVRLNKEQENPFWTTGVDEYRVALRPGTPMVLEYPLFETSQIDGTVEVPSGAAGGMSVELVSTEGQVVAVTRTAFDGYYLLQGVMPGAYTLRISDESLQQRGFKQAQEYSITIKASDFYIKDIVLTPAVE